MLYLDLAELPELFDPYWFWSARRRALAQFRREDHLGDKQQPLADSVRELVAQRSGFRPAGPIRLLTHLAYFGYRFNPVSFYYCFDPTDDHVEAVVAEINNTPWGEQHCYVLDARDAGVRAMRFELNKDFHVSPFLPMDIVYDWRFTAPGDALAVHMRNLKEGNLLFDATLKLQRKTISRGTLALVLIRYPFMTLKVITAIYYQALRLWLKRIPFYPHPDQKEAPHSASTP
jgi:DUF1365 family protein